jgi:molecular chaperone DnaJ
VGEKRDYYDVLGVKKDASLSDIKTAYRRLAKQLHPDHNKEADAEERFNEVREAYEVLSNEQKRKAYDQFGHAGTQGFDPDSAGGYPGFGGTPFDMGDLSDMFSNIFGGMGGFGFDFGGIGGARRQTRKGADIRVGISLDFEDSIWGKEEEIVVERGVLCEDCKGTGAESGNLKTCAQCGGQGRVRRVQNTFLGGISVVTECPECRGKGSIPERECHTCRGNGIVNEKKNLKIRIPEGSYDGMVLRFRHGGQAGRNGGEYGDLYVELQVEPDARFERRDDDIYVEVKIPVVSAVLGDVVDVPTVHGDVTLKVPSGTQPNTVFKLSKKGSPHLGGRGFGDEYVRVKVEVPKRVGRREKQLWEELRG